MSLKMSMGEMTSSAIAAATNLSGSGTRASRTSGTVRRTAVFATRNKRMSLMMPYYPGAAHCFTARPPDSLRHRKHLIGSAQDEYCGVVAHILARVVFDGFE